MERIALAREYRVAEWLRDAYLELTKKTPLDFEALRPTELCSNSLDRNWEATSRDWETLARILYLQTKVAALIMSFDGVNRHCYECNTGYGGSYSNACLCKCRLLAMVDETFRGELESLRENPGNIEDPLTRKLPESQHCIICVRWKQFCIANSTNSAALHTVHVSGVSKKKKGKKWDDLNQRCQWQTGTSSDNFRVKCVGWLAPVLRIPNKRFRPKRIWVVHIWVWYAFC